MILVYAVVLLGILIFVHELGHFLFAKSLGVKVLKFSLGFGPRIVGKTIGETEYRISSIPLGGYVKMLGEEPGEELDEAERKRAYNHQPVWKRFVIVFSGPFFNIVFAGFVFALIFLTGVPVPWPDIGKIEDGSAAERAGLRTGDRVLTINGEKILSWDEIYRAVERSSGSPLNFEVDRDGQVLGITVTAVETTDKNIFGEEKKFWDIGASPLLRPDIGEVVPGAPADKAGLMKGDRILDIGGSPVATWQDMSQFIHASPEKPLVFTIRRGEETFQLTITPEKKAYQMPDGEERQMGLIGIRPAGNDYVRKFAPVAAVVRGVQRTWDVTVLTMVTVVKLIQNVVPAKTIGGPILIFQMAGQQASEGALSFFNFMAIISINLGILNLLPIPILDGGHLMFLGIEAVRRKPLSENAILIAQKVGLVLLLTLMAFAFYNDILRLITGKMIP